MGIFCAAVELRRFEYMLQSHELSDSYPLYKNHSELITGQCKKILSRANKNKIQVF